MEEYVKFLLSTLVVLLLLFIIIFYAMRSSEQLPKNWQQFVMECKIQGAGATAMLQDMLARRRNKVALFKQPGKLAVITGGNRGIGLKVVEKLMKCDMTIVVGVRDPEKAKISIESALDMNRTQGKLFYEMLDIGDMKSVLQFAENVKKIHKKIDILINNAGIMNCPFKLTADNFESQMAVNYYGHFLLTHLLLPEIKAAGRLGANSRVVNVSSCAHLMGSINYKDMNNCNDYYPANAYTQSKLAQVLFTKQMEVLLRDEGAHTQVHSVHPGIVDTDLFENSNMARIPFFNKLFKTPEEGARTIVYAAISPEVEGNGGTYLSNCAVAKCHSAADSLPACEKLFKYSCEQLKIKRFSC